MFGRSWKPSKNILLSPSTNTASKIEKIMFKTGPVYVFHKGQRSFGSQTQRLEGQAPAAAALAVWRLDFKGKGDQQPLNVPLLRAVCFSIDGFGGVVRGWLGGCWDL